MTVRAAVLAWGKAPPGADGSDFVPFSRRFVIAEYGVVTRDVWALWYRDAIPPVGAECLITYHMGRVETQTVEPVDRWRDHAVLDGFRCEPPT